MIDATYEHETDVCTVCGKMGGLHYTGDDDRRPDVGTVSFCHPYSRREWLGFGSFSYTPPDPDLVMDKGL